MAGDRRKNPYIGVNAHVQSYLQSDSSGGWKMFHNAYLTYIAEALDAQLPPSYEVGMTTSLQIVEFHPDTGQKVCRPEPDITIYKIGSLSGPSGGEAGIAEPTVTVRAAETLQTDDEFYLSSLMIYQISERWDS